VSIQKWHLLAPSGVCALLGRRGGSGADDFWFDSFRFLAYLVAELESPSIRGFKTPKRMFLNRF
jgi:hypothetical protein